MLEQQNIELLEEMIGGLHIDRPDIEQDRYDDSDIDIETYLDYYLNEISNHFNLKWNDNEHIPLFYKIQLLYILYNTQYRLDSISKYELLLEYKGINEDDEKAEFIQRLFTELLLSKNVWEFKFEPEYQFITDELIENILYTIVTMKDISNDINLQTIKQEFSVDFVNLFIRLSVLDNSDIEEEIKQGVSDKYLAIAYLLGKIKQLPSSEVTRNIILKLLKTINN